MKTILALACSILFCLSASAQTDFQTRLHISTRSADGVIIDYLCDGTKQLTIAGPEVDIDLPRGSDVSLQTLENSSLIGRHNDDDDSVTLQGDFEITIRESGGPQICLIVKEATITMKNYDENSKRSSDESKG